MEQGPRTTEESTPRDLLDEEFKERKGIIESVVGDKIDKLARRFLLAEKLGLKEEVLKQADEIKKLYEEAEKETEFQTKWSDFLARLYQHADTHYQSVPHVLYESGFKKFIEAKFGTASAVNVGGMSEEPGEFVVVSGTDYVFRFYKKNNEDTVALSNWPYMANLVRKNGNPKIDQALK